MHTLTHSARAASQGDAENILGPNVTYIRPSVLSDLLAWLPALFILVGMPVVAVIATKYVFLPSVKQAYSQSAAGDNSGPMMVEKLAVDTRTSAQIHNGFRSVALIGADGVFLDKVSHNREKLTAVAREDLKGVSMPDLDRVGAVEGLRAKLQTDLNKSLGGSFVKDVYIAVWPTP